MASVTEHETPWTNDEPQTNAKSACVCATRSCPLAGGRPETMKCHSERSEESCSASGGSLKEDQGEIPRIARNDNHFHSSEPLPNPEDYTPVLLYSYNEC